MPKKLGRNGNKEGSIYNTIQKIDRKEKRLNFVCNTCKNCDDWSKCNNRTGTNKCDKCIECTACLKKGVCDRFYCYNRYPAQITLDNGKRTTVSNSNTRSESVEKKKEVEAQIQTKTYVEKNGIKIIDVIKKIDATKLDAGKISESTMSKNYYEYKYIEDSSFLDKSVQKVTYEDVQNFLNSLRHLSQSEISRIINKLKAGFMKCVMDKVISYPDNPMLRIYAPISLQTRKVVEAFEVSEQRKLMSYIRTHTLVKSDKSSYDDKTIRNLLICSLLSAARVGELGAIQYKNIDLKEGGLNIKKTLTHDINDKVIMGSLTKTGRKKVEKGELDERFVPFDIFDKELMKTTIEDQIRHSKTIKNNKNNLLFCKKDGNFIDHRSITSIFKRICREAGVKLNLPKGCHIHMCRHTCATRMIEAGMDLLVIATILGHRDDSQIKQTYGHILNRYINKQLRNSRSYYKQNNLSA